MTSPFDALWEDYHDALLTPSDERSYEQEVLINTMNSYELGLVDDEEDGDDWEDQLTL